MREDICSIPINDVFLPMEGCPFCTMRDMLEDRLSTYITGAAMMEPDVREETNRLGFCEPHFRQILARGSRLSVALILESLTASIQAEVFPAGNTAPKKLVQAAHNRSESCFTCENLEMNTRHLMDSLFHLWQTDAAFQKLYAQQKYICLPHYSMVLGYAEKKLPKKVFPWFAAETAALSRRHLEALSADVTHFCRMFDYRNKDGDWGTSRDAIERTFAYLTARTADTAGNAGEKNR